MAKRKNNTRATAAAEFAELRKLADAIRAYNRKYSDGSDEAIGEMCVDEKTWGRWIAIAKKAASTGGVVK